MYSTFVLFVNQHFPGLPASETQCTILNEKNWPRVPDGFLTPRQTDQLSVGRKITLTLTLT
jgi:hypothetical protein